MQPSSPQGSPAETDLAALYDRHGAALYRYLLGVMGRPEDAEDTLQEVYVRLGASRRPVLAPDAYLWRAARNEARRQIARKTRRREREEAATAGRFPARWNAELAPDQRLALHRALDRLPFEQREAVVLMGLEGLTAREAGQRTETPANTAASRYRLGLSKLRNELERPQ